MLTEHGRFYPDRYRYNALLVKPLLAQVTPAIVAIAGATRKALARYEFMLKRHIRVIYNGIEMVERDAIKSAEVRHEYGLPGTALVFGTVSRLYPVKNQTRMIRAFQQILNDYPNVLLLLVGDGPERSALEQLVAELELESKVFFIGFISDPAAYLESVDVFYCPLLLKARR
jgi:glycosyltransferase involved in cell wall biosynthesis